MAQLGNVHVPMNRPPAANLEMVHAQFVLGLAETVLDRETRKRYVQQPGELLKTGTRRHVGHKVLHLVVIQRVAGDDQRMRRTESRIISGETD